MMTVVEIDGVKRLVNMEPIPPAVKAYALALRLEFDSQNQGSTYTLAGESVSSLHAFGIPIHVLICAQTVWKTGLVKC